MGIKVVHREKRECKCELPHQGDWVVGDIVQCEDCETYWRCQGLGPRDQYKPGDETLKWEKVRKLFSEHLQRTVYDPFNSGLL
jgi:hypothetical protein